MLHTKRLFAITLFIFLSLLILSSLNFTSVTADGGGGLICEDTESTQTVCLTDKLCVSGTNPPQYSNAILSNGVWTCPAGSTIVQSTELDTATERCNIAAIMNEPAACPTVSPPAACTDGGSQESSRSDTNNCCTVKEKRDCVYTPHSGS